MIFDFDLYITDLNEMAKSAHDTCEESCEGCPNHDECMNSMRHSIGDLAQALAHTIDLIKHLEHTIKDLAHGIKDNLIIEEEYNTEEIEMKEDYYI